ncbi:MAG: SH3 domain-containing protein [Hyphomicrobium sp.]
MLSTNSLKTLILAVLILFPYEGFAYSGKLKGQEIKEILTGASIQLDTPFGTTIPISFGSDGIITGQAGLLATYLGSAEDRGRWWISNHKLCFKWFKWLHGESQCLSLKLDDHQISWVLEDGVEGTATLKDKPVEDKKYILRSPPKLAVHPLSLHKKQFVSSEGREHKGIFSLGVHLSRALQSENNSKNIELSKTQTASELKSYAPLGFISQTATPDTNDTPDKDKSRSTKSSETANRLNREFVTASVQPQISRGRYMVVSGVENGDTLNIRSGPSLDQSIVGEIPQNSNKLLGPCMNFWCKIQYKNVYGWVNRFYLADTLAAQKQNYN